MIADRSEEASRPCLLIAHGDATYASLAARAFRRLGWDTYDVRSGPEARRLARMLHPDIVVLGADIEGESGWLTCEKIKRDRPLIQVFLVGDSDLRNDAFAAFVGATALVDRSDSISALVNVVTGRHRAAAG